MLGLGGCSKRYDNVPAFLAFPLPDAENNSVGRFKTSYLADQIHAYFRGNAGGPIAVATFVDLDNLYGTSTFGRLLAEQLMSELAMKGYNVLEVRQSDALQVLFEQGEFGLSREVTRLRSHQDVSGLVVGTYTVSPVRIYINARLIDPASSVILSAGTVEMSKTDEIARMLRNNAFPSSLERIPVRTLAYYSYPLPYYWPYGATRQRMFEEEDDFSMPRRVVPEEQKAEEHKESPQPKL
jgi:TolB-like protein